MDVLINIDVPDINKGIAFYTAALGLKVGRRFDATFVELIGGSSPIYLLGKEEGTRTSNTIGTLRDYKRHWTPVHFDVIVKDINAAVEQAQSAGAKLESEIKTEAYGLLALMSDPFGHGFCLLQFTGRGYDEL